MPQPLTLGDLKKYQDFMCCKKKFMDICGFSNFEGHTGEVNGSQNLKNVQGININNIF